MVQPRRTMIPRASCGGGINDDRVLQVAKPSSESRNGHQHSHYADPDRAPLRPVHRHSNHRTRQLIRISPATAICALLAGSIHTTMAQNGCISLAGSTACPAFSAASISTSSDLVGLFPFLSNVSDTSSFDTGIADFIAGPFTQIRYVDSLSLLDPSY